MWACWGGAARPAKMSTVLVARAPRSVTSALSSVPPSCYAYRPNQCWGCGMAADQLKNLCVKCRILEPLPHAEVVEIVRYLGDMGLHELDPAELLHSRFLRAAEETFKFKGLSAEGKIAPSKQHSSLSTSKSIKKTVTALQEWGCQPNDDLTKRLLAMEALDTTTIHFWVKRQPCIWLAVFWLDKILSVKEVMRLSTRLHHLSSYANPRLRPVLGRHRTADLFAQELKIRRDFINNPGQLGFSRLTSCYIAIDETGERRTQARQLQEIVITPFLPHELARIVLLHELVHAALWLKRPYNIGAGGKDPSEETICHIVTLQYIKTRLSLLSAAHKTPDQQLHDRIILQHRYKRCYDDACRDPYYSKWTRIYTQQGWEALAASFFSIVRQKRS